jgi:hypothetical protein
VNGAATTAPLRLSTQPCLDAIIAWFKARGAALRCILAVHGGATCCATGMVATCAAVVAQVGVADRTELVIEAPHPTTQMLAELVGTFRCRRCAACGRPWQLAARRGADVRTALRCRAHICAARICAARICTAHICAALHSKHLRCTAAQRTALRCTHLHCGAALRCT